MPWYCLAKTSLSKTVIDLKVRYAYATLRRYSVMVRQAGWKYDRDFSIKCSLWLAWLLGWFQWSQSGVSPVLEPPLLQQRSSCMAEVLYDIDFFLTEQLKNYSHSQKDGVAIPVNSEDWVWLSYSHNELRMYKSFFSLLLHDLKISGCKGSFWTWASLQWRCHRILLVTYASCL